MSTKELLDRLGKAGRIAFSRANLDPASIPAKKGERRCGYLGYLEKKRLA